MKIVTLIARLLLGLIFVVFGLNGFLNFLSMGPMPLRIGRAIHWRTRTLSLLLGNRGATNRGRRAVVGEPFRAAGPGAAGTGYCEHTPISLVAEHEWRGAGNRCSHSLVHCFLRASPILLWDICPTFVSNRGSYRG